MLIKVNTAALSGVEGYPVTVEADLHRGMPEFHIVGLADTMIRESCKRIRPAVQNSGYPFPLERLTVNLMPASRPKVGSHFDLPIAVTVILLMLEQEWDGYPFRDTAEEDGWDEDKAGAPAPGRIDAGDIAFFGELSLDGRINPVRGILPLILSCRKAGIRTVILPAENREEAAMLKDVTVLPVTNLRQVIDHLTGRESILIYKGRKRSLPDPGALDYGQVIGQEGVKRAMVIGAAGRHGMLLMGSPGCGKTMMARRLPTILPAMTYEEQLEVMGIYSIAGKLEEGRVITGRPFRSPHHSITMTGLIGGGARPRPGELSLAHRGVLFLDELGEFDGRVIDSLRQPVEDGFVRISRTLEEVTFPAEVMVVVASNPCRCGHLWDERKLCTCTRRELASHRKRLMGPFADRIDMHIRMMPVDREVIEKGWESAKATDSAAMREQVEKAREIQRRRYEGMDYDSNGQLDDKGLRRFCALDREGSRIMSSAYERLGLSMRGYQRLLRVARTIADLEGTENIEARHVAEALAYRPCEMGEEDRK